MAKVVTDKTVTIELTGTEYIRALYGVLSQALISSGLNGEYRITGYTMPGTIDSNDDQCTVSFRMEKVANNANLDQKS